MNFRILLTAAAKRMFDTISDRRVRDKVQERIDDLAQDPQVKGKPLVEELMGYRSLRAAGQRYRIIYSVDERRLRVLVVGVGARKEGSKRDIYALAKKLLRLHLAPSPE